MLMKIRMINLFDERINPIISETTHFNRIFSIFTFRKVQYKVLQITGH